MEDLLQNLPLHVPKPGFYYHYKHDPEGSFDNYAYEVVAIGHHTEEDARPLDSYMVNYRPLYDHALVYRIGSEIGVPVYDNRPLEMFMEDVIKDGITRPRFTRITDPGLIERLKGKRDQMYRYESGV